MEHQSHLVTLVRRRTHQSHPAAPSKDAPKSSHPAAPKSSGQVRRKRQGSTKVIGPAAPSKEAPKSSGHSSGEKKEAPKSSGPAAPSKDAPKSSGPAAPSKEAPKSSGHSGEKKEAPKSSGPAAPSKDAHHPAQLAHWSLVRRRRHQSHPVQLTKQGSTKVRLHQSHPVPHKDGEQEGSTKIIRPSCTKQGSTKVIRPSCPSCTKSSEDADKKDAQVQHQSHLVTLVRRRTHQSHPAQLPLQGSTKVIRPSCTKQGSTKVIPGTKASGHSKKEAPKSSGPAAPSKEAPKPSGPAAPSKEAPKPVGSPAHKDGDHKRPFKYAISHKEDGVKRCTKIKYRSESSILQTKWSKASLTRRGDKKENRFLGHKDGDKKDAGVSKRGQLTRMVTRRMRFIARVQLTWQFFKAITKTSVSIIIGWLLKSFRDHESEYKESEKKDRETTRSSSQSVCFCSTLSQLTSLNLRGTRINELKLAWKKDRAKYSRRTKYKFPVRMIQTLREQANSTMSLVQPLVREGSMIRFLVVWEELDHIL